MPLPQEAIPNTTNLLDGHFAELKNKLRNHNGLSAKRRIANILRFLAPALVGNLRQSVPAEAPLPSSPVPPEN